MEEPNMNQVREEDHQKIMAEANALRRKFDKKLGDSQFLRKFVENIELLEDFEKEVEALEEEVLKKCGTATADVEKAVKDLGEQEEKSKKERKELCKKFMRYDTSDDSLNV